MPEGPYPELNLLSPSALLPLSYRALAGSADPRQAELTSRRIEHVGAEVTELTKLVSELKARCSIAQEKAAEAKQSFVRTDLDLKLLAEQQPAVAPRKRGLFAARPTPTERAEQQRLAELNALRASGEAASVARQRAAHQLQRDLRAAEERLERTRNVRLAHTAVLAEQLAARVLELVAAARSMQLSDPAAAFELRSEVLELLTRMRTGVRGDLMVGALIVLAELFLPALGLSGPQAAQQSVLELRTLFEQHKEPLPRLLLNFIQLYEAGIELAAAGGGGPPQLPEMGLLGPDSFSVKAHFRLYQLAMALSGLGMSAAELTADAGADAAGAGNLGQQLRRMSKPGGAADDLFTPTLLLVNEVIMLGRSRQSWQALPPDVLAEVSGRGDPALRLLAAHLLLRSGRVELLCFGAGAPYSAERLGGGTSKKPVWPALMSLLHSEELSGWPLPYAQHWLSALACHILLAARQAAPPELFAQWLEESYGWPKDDLYWYTLASVKQDPALLRELRGGTDQLFRTPGVLRST